MARYEKKPVIEQPLPVKRYELDAPPKITDVVMYYQNGDTRDGAIPAFVVGMKGRPNEGLVDLLVLRKNTLQLKTVENVRHIRDPHLKARPALRQSRGGWEYTENDRAVVEMKRLLKQCKQLKADLEMLIAATRQGRKPFDGNQNTGQPSATDRAAGQPVQGN